jgi:hypothetical protein
MATLKQVTEAEKQLARKVGKIPKAPKKPKRSASITVLENYTNRHNAWADKIKAMASLARQKEALLKQIFKFA